MEIFNQDLKNIKAKLSQTTKVPQSTNPKSNNIIEGPASKKYHYNKDYLKALSREDLEQIVLSQGHHTSLSSLSSLYSLPSQAHSRNSVIENGFDPAVSSSQKVETLAKPNNAEQDAPAQSGSSYPLYNPIKSKDPSHSKSVSASGGVSFDANIPAITEQVGAERSTATKELIVPKKSSNASSTVLGYSLGDLGVQPQTLLQHPGLDIDVNKKPGSKHGSISGEKENYQATSRVEHVPSELLSYTGVNKDLINSVLPLQNSAHIVVKNIRSEANSAAFAGAMKALQEKVRKLEAENDHLKKSLESKDYYYEHEQWSNTGNMIQGTEEDLARVIEELKTQNDWLVRENQQMHEQIIKDDGKDGIEGQIGKMNEVIHQLKGGNENVKKSARYNNTNQSEGANVELELAQRKIYELELIKTELYNSKLELEARLNQVICSVENNERVFQDKITELEAHLKDATVQNELHSKEISILNSHLGREKINLSEALEEIRAAYKDKIEQCTANIEALRSDRRSLRKIAKAQNEENKALQKKVKSLEKIVMASESLYNKDTSKEGILDHLRQINNTLLSKARDTTNSSIPTIENSYGEDKGRKSHGLSFSELTTKSALKSSARSSRSKSPNKEKNLLSASYTHRPCRNKENEYDLSFSYRVASSPLGKNSSAKKSRKSSAKKKSKKSRTPERKSSRETKDNSILTSRTQGLLMSSRNLSPNQTRHTLTGYSILADGNSKKKTPTKTSNGGYSPRFSNEPSLVKAQLFYPRSISTERGERTQKSIAKLETEIDALKKDHKNLLSSSLQPMKISTKSESLKRIIGMIEDKSNSLAVLKSLQKKSSGKKK